MSVRLTRRNWHGPLLHPQAQAATIQPVDTNTNLQLTDSTSSERRVVKQRRDAPVKLEHSKSLRATAEVEADADIYAPPLSSDDEQSPTGADDTKRTLESVKRKRDEVLSSPANKRQKTTTTTTKGTRSSQRRKHLVDQPGGSMSTTTETFEAPPNDPQTTSKSLSSKGETRPQQDTFDVPDPTLDWFSQPISSQSSQRRTRTTFSRNGQHHPTTKVQSDKSFAVPDDVPKKPPNTPRKAKLQSFMTVPESPTSRGKSVQDRSIQPSAQIDETVQNMTKFNLPEDPSLEMISSSNSLATETSATFDMDNLSDSPNRQRRGSTSSLSSSDSIASHQLSQSQKQALKEGKDPPETLPPDLVRCPHCSDAVPRSIFSSSMADPTKLSLRAQRDFCDKHKIHDAHAQWKTRGYPEIDWAGLESKRIPTHLPHLSRVLYRKTDSFYLSTLESKVTEARGNQRKIRSYLVEGIVDVAKPGYYGPRGAKIMGHVITTEFSRRLKTQLRADKIVGMAGVSGFISAVLVPELCQRLVMEDLKSSDGDEARKVLSESTDVGLLVNPDDDHVDADENVL